MSKRESVSARLDPEVLQVVEHVAEVERRPLSSLVRNIVSDWAKARQAERGQAA
jgi:predicted transcriptional regulator